MSTDSFAIGCSVCLVAAVRPKMSDREQPSPTIVETREQNNEESDENSKLRPVSTISAVTSSADVSVPVRAKANLDVRSESVSTTSSSRSSSTSSRPASSTRPVSTLSTKECEELLQELAVGKEGNEICADCDKPSELKEKKKTYSWCSVPSASFSFFLFPTSPFYLQ